MYTIRANIENTSAFHDSRICVQTKLLMRLELIYQLQVVLYTNEIDVVACWFQSEESKRDVSIIEN